MITNKTKLDRFQDSVLKKHILNIILLSIVTIGTVLTSPKWVIPIFAWIVPIALLAFIRRNSKWKSLLLGMLSVGIGVSFAWHNVLPLPNFIFPALVVAISFITMIPFMVDKWLVGDKWKSFSSTLVFPITLGAIEYLSSFNPAQGTWSSIAYTQYGNLPMMQLVSVTGIWGISFLIYWTASVFIWVIENGERQNRAKAFFGFKIYASVLLIVFLFGSIRLTPLFTNTDDQVRIAAVTMPAGLSTEILKTAYKAEFNKEVELSDKSYSPSSPAVSEAYRGMKAFIDNSRDPKFDSVYNKIEQSQNTLFSLSQKEVDGGAKIVAWSEAVAMTLLEEKDDLVLRGQEFARKNQVYLMMGMAVMTPGEDKADNIVVTISPEGEVMNTYGKSIPVIGESSKGGDGIVPVIETEYGNISVVICYDADHPALVQQIGSGKTDILIVPSADWKAIVPYHSNMSAFRAVENGVSLVRSVANGQTLAVDHKGQVLFSTQEASTSGWVPAKKIKTIYSYVGDLFAWLLILGLFVIIIVRKLIKKKSKK